MPRQPSEFNKKVARLMKTQKLTLPEASKKVSAELKTKPTKTAIKKTLKEKYK